MKISHNWLKSYIDHNLNAEDLGKILTSTGLEVEHIEIYESTPGGFKNIVVGEVLTKEKHPEADRLSITTVNTGTGIPLQIVCGAANVEAGQKVIVALVGAKCMTSTGEQFEIKKSKIRGQVSEGMICAEDELGLGSSHDGIMVLPAEVMVGVPAASYFNLENDYILEIGLTPNRADATSHIGVARDIKAFLNTSSKELSPVQINWPIVPEKIGSYPNPVAVSVEDTSACPRYSGLFIKNVKVAPSPDWLSKKLKSIGIKTVNNIVDITNFVLHEMGQPLHAFDADAIKGNKVVVKKNVVQKFTTLDNIEREIQPDDLMICNAEGPMCIAGVFGGSESGVKESTSNIFLESAYFNAVSVRKTSKAHGLKTDASFRYERGTDPEITVYALKRAALLIAEIAGGEISEITDVYSEPIKKATVELSFSEVTRLTGIDFAGDVVKEILSNLDIEIILEKEDGLTLYIPSYRVDVTRACDVVEELLRIYGYNNIPEPEMLKSSLNYQKKPDQEKLKNTAADLLVSKGFYEVMNNSLTSGNNQKRMLGSASESLVNVLNPLSSDLDVMRATMVTGMLENIQYNRNRKSNDLQLFEFGNIYNNYNGRYVEEQRLCISVSGNSNVASWNTKKAAADIFYIKGIVESVTARFGLNYQLAKAEHEMFDQCIELKNGKQSLGYIGSIKKSLLKHFDLSTDVFMADLKWEQLFSKGISQVKYRELSKFPAVHRDLAMILDKKIEYSQLEKIALNAERKLLKEVNLFDVYEGDKIEQGKKSYALSFTLQDNTNTLTDKQIEASMERIMKALETEAGAQIRKG